jgi:uncharacterized protein
VSNQTVEHSPHCPTTAGTKYDYHSTPKPTLKKRIIGYDLARSLAVIGMVFVNFKIVMGSDQDGPPWLAHLVGLLEGRAAATFVVLAGAGLSLMSHKGRTQNNKVMLAQDRQTLLKRACFLFVIGLLYLPIWPADILHFYGIYIAIAAFLLATPTRRLCGYSGSLALLFVMLFFSLNYEQGWNWDTLEYTGLWTPTGMVRRLFYNGFHPVIPWLAFILLGQALGRQDMSNPRIRRRVFYWGAGVAIAAEFTSWVLIRVLSSGVSLADQEVVVAIFGTKPMPPMPLYILAAAGTACAVIAACIALGERFPANAWLRPFAAMGQLALTLYVAHVVVGMGVLEGIGRLENQSLPFTLIVATIFCIASLIFAHLWRSQFKRGPIEALMRILTDPKRPTKKVDI